MGSAGRLAGDLHQSRSFQSSSGMEPQAPRIRASPSVEQDGGWQAYHQQQDARSAGGLTLPDHESVLSADSGSHHGSGVFPLRQQPPSRGEPAMYPGQGGSPGRVSTRSNGHLGGGASAASGSPRGASRLGPQGSRAAVGDGFGRQRGMRAASDTRAMMSIATRRKSEGRQVWAGQQAQHQARAMQDPAGTGTDGAADGAYP